MDQITGVIQPDDWHEFLKDEMKAISETKKSIYHPVQISMRPSYSSRPSRARSYSMTETFDYIIEHKIQNDLRNKFHQMGAQTRQKILKLFLAMKQLKHDSEFSTKEAKGILAKAYPDFFIADRRSIARVLHRLKILGFAEKKYDAQFKVTWVLHNHSYSDDEMVGIFIAENERMLDFDRKSVAGDRHNKTKEISKEEKLDEGLISATIHSQTSLDAPVPTHEDPFIADLVNKYYELQKLFPLTDKGTLQYIFLMLALENQKAMS